MTNMLERPGKPALACRFTPGAQPCVVFVHGFMSDMHGAKPAAIEAFCREQDLASLCFELSGHGASQGAFRDGTITAWRQDVLDVIDQLTSGPVILVGSSLGGWLSLLATLARPERVQALVLIAPAPDFTRWGLFETMTPDQRTALERDGFIAKPSAYGPEPYIITRHLIEDGDAHRLFDGSIAVHCPVRILQGRRDPDVPWRTALKIMDALETPDVHVRLIKDGDHRLSRDEDLLVLTRTLADLTGA